MGIPAITFTPAKDFPEALSRAGAMWGIEPEYWDIFGKRHVAAPEVQKEILQSIGVPTDSLAHVNQAMEDGLWREWTAVVAPVCVVSGENPIEATVRVPEALAGGTLRSEVQLEDGGTAAAEHKLKSLPATRRAQLRGQAFVEKRLPLGEAPLGYHRLRVSIARGGEAPLEGEAWLIVTPDRAYLPLELRGSEKRAGLYASLYAIHSSRSWGCGDFSDLERLAAWLAREANGSFVALNPLHAIHNREPYNTSPYMPISIFYRNFIYLDIERIPDYQASACARKLRASPNVEAEIRALNESDLVEYQRVARLKKAFLRLAFRQFLKEYRTGGERARQFQEFITSERDLLDGFATYCALDEWIHKRQRDVWTWNNWPPEYQDPSSEATRRFKEEHWRSVLFYKYAQWLIDLQAAEAQAAARRSGLGIGVFHDLALAVDGFGADLWAYRPFYVSGCRVGAPPDDFSPNGQDWSFPPPASERHFQNGYQLFRDSIRKACRHGGALRIDHVMRFFRLFWIPGGKKPASGAYVRDRHEDLIRVLALESVRNQVVVVGEDLGTVEPKIREILTKFGILGYRVFYFEKNKQGEFRPPQEYPRPALVSSTTHDLPTLVGFWTGRDIDARREAKVLPDEKSYKQAIKDRRREKQKILDALAGSRLLPGVGRKSVDDYPEVTPELHKAVISFLASTPSVLLAINQEDLTKEREQQNLPGTTAEHPNWRRKMRYSIDELETSDEVREMMATVRAALKRAGRREHAAPKR
ncbi:MAG: 4-alpha-glucanotransferase [Bryobacteraceae bacterium]|nr:4-alpha-glucanotransferase [Bryobacteraceae bacterium]